MAEDEEDSGWISAPGEGQQSCLPGATAQNPDPSDAGTFREGPGCQGSPRPQVPNTSLPNYFTATFIDFL